MQGEIGAQEKVKVLFRGMKVMELSSVGQVARQVRYWIRVIVMNKCGCW